MIIIMESMRETITRNFNRLVKESGMKKREIAHQLHISEATLQRWKAGLNIPEVTTIEALAGVLGVDPIEFYKREDNIAPMSPRGALKKYLVIPDEIVEGLSHFAPDDEVWEMIKTAIRIQNEEAEAKAREKKA